LIVMACAALLLRTGYEYFLRYADVVWVQFWWAITFFNAWFMVVGDDPLCWFYYNWGFSTFPVVVLLWWAHRRKRSEGEQPASPEGEQPQSPADSARRGLKWT
jgi:hypothetical protein